MLHVMRASRNSRGKDTLRKFLKQSCQKKRRKNLSRMPSRKTLQKNQNRKKQHVLRLRKLRMPLQSLMRYGTAKHRIIM